MPSRASALALAVCATLYGGAALADNTSPSYLTGEVRAEFQALMPADIADRFVLHAEPRPFRDEEFKNGNGQTVDLRDVSDEVTLVNFWATWCAPCVAEMPSLDSLQADLGGAGLTVVAISVDRMPLKRAVNVLQGKLANNGYSANYLEFYHDSRSQLARQMGVLGIPVTAILGPDGREIGRLEGEADWGSPQAVRWLNALIDAIGTRTSI